MVNQEKVKQIAENIESQNAQFIAVTKMRSTDEIMELYSYGYKVYGENKVQELLPKYEFLPNDIEWHMIGHMQTNKVKYIAPFIFMIQSVDSLKLLHEINKRAAQNNRVIKVLFEVKIARDDSKFGFSRNEVFDLFRTNSLAELKNIEVCGLMGMASLTVDTNLIGEEFEFLRNLFEEIKKEFNPENFDTLSMGMSSDYEIALENGSNMVRLGTILFKN